MSPIILPPFRNESAAAKKLSGVNMPTLPPSDAGSAVSFCHAVFCSIPAAPLRNHAKANIAFDRKKKEAMGVRVLLCSTTANNHCDSTLPYATLLHAPLRPSVLLCVASALLCSTLLCSAPLYSALLFSTLRCSVRLDTNLLHSVALGFALLRSNPLYSTLLFAALVYSSLSYSALI